MRNNVRKAMPKFLKTVESLLKGIYKWTYLKWACSPSPSQGCWSEHSNLPNSSTPSAAKMKKSRKKSDPKLPTCGRAKNFEI